MRAQRSGSHLERRRSGGSEPCRRRRGERSGACADVGQNLGQKKYKKAKIIRWNHAIPADFWLQGKNLNLRPPGYEGLIGEKGS